MKNCPKVPFFKSQTNFDRQNSVTAKEGFTALVPGTWRVTHEAHDEDRADGSEKNSGEAYHDQPPRVRGPAGAPSAAWDQYCKTIFAIIELP